MNNNKSDVVIVGAGLAGIVAAIECLQNKLSVTVLDRDTQSNLGGLAKKAFGGMCLIDTPLQKLNRIKDSAELGFQDWTRFGEMPESDTLPREWAKRYCEYSHTHIYAWLKQYGINFLPVVSWVERGLEIEGNSVPRYHVLWGTGQGLIERLLQVLEQLSQRNKLNVLFEHKVEALAYQNQQVCGVKAINAAGESLEFHAEHTIIASGGFNGNLAFVRENWPSSWSPAPEHLLNGSHRYADATLHQAVSHIGGKLTHLDQMWNYAAGIPKPESDLKPDDPESAGLSLIPCKSALWINALGERIGPRPLVTGYDTNYLVQQICKQPKGFSWQILNRKIAEKEIAISGVEHNPHIRDKKLLAFLWETVRGNRRIVDYLTQNSDAVLVADNLPELMQKMQAHNEGLSLNQAQLTALIESYDQQIKRGQTFSNDEQIRLINHSRLWRGDKVRTCFQQPIIDPKAGPLIAIKEHIVSRKSMGGIQTDLYGRVLDQQGQVIQGLYASGEAAGFGGGGISGKRSLEGTFLSSCIFNSRVICHGIQHGQLLGA